MGVNRLWVVYNTPTENLMVRIAEKIKDLLWPRTCPVRDCGCISDRPGRYICSRCHASLPWYDEFAKSAFAYLTPMAELINSFKFGGATYLTDDFADAMADSFRKKHDASAVDAVMPVPLHPNRLRERGYNQAGLLAAAFAARIGRLCDETSLVRAADTEHQSRSSGDERRRNLKGAFRVVDARFVRGRTIALIDDVMTTGSTLGECTDVLLSAGAYRVVPFALAKALMDEDLGEDFRDT